MSPLPVLKNSLSPSGFAGSSALRAKRQFLALAIAVSTLAGLAQPVQAAAIIDQAAFADGDIAISGPGVTINGPVHTNGNFNISGGSTVNGFVSAVGTVTNDGGNPGFLNGGSQAGAAPKTYPSMSAVLAAIGMPYTEITPSGGTLFFSGSEPFSGVYWVHGNVDLSSDAPGVATFLADGNIDISASASITSAVLNDSFPFGLTLYSATGYVNVSDATIGGSVAGKTTVNISGATTSSPAPEPSSALLLSLGCVGAAVMRKRKKA